MAYLTVFVVFIISGIIWLVSAETYALAAGATGDARFHGCPLALTLAASQTVGFCAVYGLGQSVLRFSKKLKAKVEAFDVERFQASAMMSLGLGAIFGIPPLLVMAVVAGTLKYDFRRFVALVFLGRIVRFGLLYYFGRSIVDAVGPWLGLEIPEALPF